MVVSPESLVRQIHDSKGKIVLAVSGGGSGTIGDLLEVPGASHTVLEAVVPYCEAAMIALLGGPPERFCAAGTSRAMAMAAFRRACRYAQDESDALTAGVACTAALATDRPRRGSHRTHVALQTATRTACWSVELEKDRRSRAAEELLVGRLMLNAVAEACGIDRRLDLQLLEGEHVDASSTVAPKAWRDLVLGRVASVRHGEARPTDAIFPGAFNPLHAGHRRMAEIARGLLGVTVAMEVSIENPDKPPLDYVEIERRVRQFAAEQPVWLTRAATFEEKSRLFPGATFVVGSDTLRRIADPKYYGRDAAARTAALERIAERGCRFLVFGRDVGRGFMGLADLELPNGLRTVCREVTPEQFRDDVSSTTIRKSGSW